MFHLPPNFAWELIKNMVFVWWLLIKAFWPFLVLLALFYVLDYWISNKKRKNKK